jgi:6,7-dimethyl-8-ribityllumazine synthase
MGTVNLSKYEAKKVPSAKKMRFGIVVSEWNAEITEALFEGTFNTLVKHGTRVENIVKEYVPGTFELTFGAASMSCCCKADAVIVLGCVVRGETPHFDYICQGVTQGITGLNEKGEIPVIFGVLTTENMQQAKDRAGGKLGNKGDEAAVTAIKMVAFKQKQIELKKVEKLKKGFL